MQKLVRSTWSVPVLLLFVVLFLTQCGSESEIVVEEGQQCLIDEFQGGSFTFTATSVNDGCSNGLLEQVYPIVGQQFGPVDLPSLDQLPPEVLIQDVPFVGDVTVQISHEGDKLFLQSPESIEVNLGPPIGGVVTAEVSGELCPRSAESMDGQLAIRILSEETPLDIPTGCTVIVQATGSL